MELRITYPYGAPPFNPNFKGCSVARSLIFLLAIMLPVLLRLTADSDYLFGIFKLIKYIEYWKSGFDVFYW